MSEVAERLAAIEARIGGACRSAGRARSEVRLVAISKKQPEARVLAAYEAGQRLFGENYVQELERRVTLLPGDAEWHFVGHLQRNKAKRAATHSAMIHTVDSARLAEALDLAAADRPTPLPVLLQVNVDREPSKSGIAPDELEPVTLAVSRLPRLALAGLMTIPAPGSGRRSFGALRGLAEDLRRRLGLPLPELSMGMSADFEDAILEGATLVRIGTDIFGERDPGI